MLTYLCVEGKIAEARVHSESPIFSHNQVLEEVANGEVVEHHLEKM